ncbi:membrane protein [Mycobacterium phage Kumao]|uniref:Membrane protein n=1 Tax=Mycobacterium phage Kumao TaxID=2041344 RepID=A0A2D1GPQ0_9CAUD|nr:membrane protein [Mycobacterium phage Kumao]ATN93997.1 membrane protein [Mycobacterium phage Kumao]
MIDVNTGTAIMGLITALATGGFLNAVWNSFTGRRAAQLNEAEIVARLSKEIREEIRAENKDLKGRMDKVVEAIIGLTDLLDDLFPKITGITPEERKALRRKINEAKLAT